MARIIALIICITLVVGGAVAAVGSIFFGWDIFGEQPTPEHTHQYSEEITKAPTCTEEGVKTFTCTVEGCDKPTYTEPVAKIPHTEVKLDGKAATCTEAGLSEGKKCSACGEITVKQETIPAAGHKEETLAAKAPTCTETGLTAGKKCSECDIVLEAQSTVPATGHKYDDEYDATCNNEGCDFVRDAACRHTNTEVLAAEAATCTKTGLTEGLKCKDCEEILTSQEIVPMIAHSWALATCTAPKTCSVCKATEGEALGHNWKPATCTDPKTCQRENCGVTEGEALGHKWKDATCTAPQICSVCTATQGEKLGHKWNDATCDAPKTCSVCKATEGSKLGHSYNAATYVWSDDYKTCTATKVCKNDASHVVTENGKVTIQTTNATCITAGTVTYTATFAQDGFVNQTKSENVDKLPHVYGTTSYDWSDDYRSCTAVKKCTGDNCYANVSETVTSTIVTVDSTCTVKGSVTYTVDFKNAEFEDQTHVEVLPLANHNLVTNSKPATCTETGLTEILKCTNCSYTEGTQEIIPLQPHTYDDSEGYATECSVCHTPRPACKHEDVEIIKGYAATCEKEGLTDGEICKTCGATVKGQTTISKAAHTPGAAATCTEPQICTVCKVVLNKATDHSFGKVNYEWIYNGDKIVACKATRTCQNSCGTSENETVNAESKIVSEAACEKAGTKTYTAVFSNSAFKTQTKDVTIPALEHSYTSVVTNPTCTAGGYTTHTCSKCNDSYTSNPLPANGHTPAEDDGDCTTAVNCTVCGTVTTPAKAHTPEADDNNCATEVKCTACGTVTTEAKAHEYGDWYSVAGKDYHEAKCDNCSVTKTENHTAKENNNCLTDTVCSVCNAKLADGNDEHNWGDWEVTETNHKHTCQNDGCAQYVEENHTPAEDDGDCTTAVNCTVCGTVTTPAKDAHTPAEDDGDCTTAVNCTVCGTVTTPAKDTHTPAEDDGDCTTAVNCTVCGTVTTPAKNDHSFTNYVSNNDATCTEDGTETATCDNCDATDKRTDEDSALDHDWQTDGTCSRGCSVKFAFEFGANGTGSEHKDGSTAQSEYSETEGIYILSLGSMNKVYPNSYDAKQNSALKLGTSSVVGSFEFTVPEEITKVYIHVAGYKANKANVKVNNGEVVEISTLSNDGEYTVIEVDTSVNKTVSFTTASGGVRCMINTIEFASAITHDHEFENGECKLCGLAEVHVHDYNHSIVVTAPTCTAVGYTTYTCSCGDSYTGNEQPVTGHIDEDLDYVCDHTNNDVKCDYVLAPDADTELSIAQACKLAKAMGNTYTSDKYYITGTIVSIDNSTYGNMTITDGNSNTIVIYGLYSANGTKVRYDAFVNKPVAGDTIKIYSVVGCYNGNPQAKDAWIAEHNATEETCDADSVCSICGTILASKLTCVDENGDGKCDNCTKDLSAADKLLASFEFGEDGSASHVDGTVISEDTYTETNGGYTLTLSNMSKVYKGACDAQGNSCLKLGTSSATASFTFTVPDNVTKVIIYVSGYKTNKANVNINDIDHTVNATSATGVYEAIEIDTSTVKTITFKTNSSAARCMLNTIEFYAGGSGSGEGGETPDPTPEYTVTFDSDGGSSVDAQTVVEGGKVTEPTAPTKDGCTFDGWFNGETKWDFDNDTVTGNIILTAKWTEESQGGGDEPTLTEKTYSYTFTSKVFTTNETKSLGGVNWTLAGDGNYWGNDGTKGHQFGSKNNPYKSMTLTSASFSNVSKVTINTCGGTAGGTVKVYVGTTQVGTITITTTSTDYSIDVNGLTGEVKFVYTNASKALYIKSIGVEYAE